MTLLEDRLTSSGRFVVRNAVSGLVRSTNRQGLWDAFTLRPGGSSDWTTAIVLHALGAAFHAYTDLFSVPVFKRCWSRAWAHFDVTNHQSIGFSHLTPPDADSTIWLRRALHQRSSLDLTQAVRLDGWMIKLDQYITRHTFLEQVHTYQPEDGILDFVGLPEGASSSWLNAHSCVTLNRVCLRYETGLLSAVEALKIYNQCEPPFWWQEPDISLLLLASAVGFHACDDDSLRRLLSQPRMIDGAVETDFDLGSILFGAQLPSGLWPPLFTLRVPDHADLSGQTSSYSHELNTEGALCTDNGIFTTALILSALACTIRRLTKQIA